MNSGTIIVLQTLADLNDRVAELVKEVKDIMVSDAPLEDRWTAYLAIEDRLPEDGCMIDLRGAEKDLDCGEISAYDDFNMDRGVTKKLSELVNMLMERSVEGCEAHEAERKAICEEHGVDCVFQVGSYAEGTALEHSIMVKHANPMINFREDILKSGCGSCCNDW